MPVKKRLATALCVAIIFSSATFAKAADAGARTTGTANVRAGAGMIHKSVGSLSGGTLAEVLAHEMSWYKIKANGITGYVSDKLIEITDPVLKEKVSYVKSNYELLSSYVSYFNASVYDRNYNIEKSAYLCYRTVNPGESFSVNKNTGNSTSRANGWREAAIIANGRYETGIGGGICQTSSTIHSAVRQLQGLTILERHPHSKPVGYVPVANEAMVSYPGSDFRFRNDYSFPVVVYADVNQIAGSITANVYKVNGAPAPIPEPFNAQKDAARLYASELEKLRADNSKMFAVLGISDENLTGVEYNLGFAIHDMDGDGMNELILSSRIQIERSGAAETHNNSILYGYDEPGRKIKLLNVLSSDFNGYEIYKDGALKWFEVNYSDQTARQISEGFAYGEPVGADYLKNRAKAEFVFNALTKENIDAYKNGALAAFLELSPVVAVNGAAVKYNAAPQNIDGRVYVEMRSLFESLGYSVEYNEITKAVTVFNENISFYFADGAQSKTTVIFKNGEETLLEILIPIKLVNDRTMFPLRFAGELLNYDVSWDDQNYKADLNGPLL